MAEETPNPILAAARALLARAEVVVGPDADQAPQPPATGVLDLYERLAERLDSVDSEQINGLLTSIDTQVADLDRLRSDMERVVRVKRNLEKNT